MTIKFLSLKQSGRKKGSALILTMLIMSGMMLVAMSGAYVVYLGIRAGGLQAQSGKAYYAAETGIEYFLYRLRKTSYKYPGPSSMPLFSGQMTDNDDYVTSYNVYFETFPPLVFKSIGSSLNSRRSVEVKIGNAANP